MSPKARILFLVGLLSAMLGCLWLLQGLGLVHLRPILCFVDCAPLQEPSGTWAIIGLIFAALGGLAVFYSIKRRLRQPSDTGGRGV